MLDQLILPAGVMLAFIVLCLVCALARDEGLLRRRLTNSEARSCAIRHGLSLEAIDMREFEEGYAAGLWFVDEAGGNATAVMVSTAYRLTFKRFQMEYDSKELGWLLAVRPHYQALTGGEPDNLREVCSQLGLRPHMPPPAAAPARTIP